MIRFLYFVVCLVLACESGPMRVKAADAASYNQMLANGQKLLKSGQLSEASSAAYAALKLDDNRWEAYGLLALVLNAQGSNTEAKTCLEKALARAPEEKKAMLQRIVDQPAACSIDIGCAFEELQVLTKCWRNSFGHLLCNCHSPIHCRTALSGRRSRNTASGADGP